MVQFNSFQPPANNNLNKNNNISKAKQDIKPEEIKNQNTEAKSTKLNGSIEQAGWFDFFTSTDPPPPTAPNTQPPADNSTSFLGGIWGGVSSVASSIWGGISSVASSIWGGISSVFNGEPSPVTPPFTYC